MFVSKYDIIKLINKNMDKLNSKRLENNQPSIELKEIWSNHQFNLADNLAEAENLSICLVFSDSTLLGDAEIGLMAEFSNEDILLSLNLEIKCYNESIFELTPKSSYVRQA